MKKIISLILLGVIVITLTACEEKEIPSNSSTGQIHEHCTRSGKTEDNSSVDMTYEIYYTGERINRIYSVEKVTSTSSETLDLYEQSYRKIHSYYSEIENYETEVIRTNDTITSIMDIDYDHIDIRELEELEGTEKNIFEDNIPKISKYKELAKEAGVKCEVVS